MSHPPRPGDLPRDELQRRAQETLDEIGPHAYVFFNFTCPECGTRCTLTDKNTLWENGECIACKVTSPIRVGGFTLVVRRE